MPEEGNVVLHAGKRKLTLSSKDLEHYTGERGRRGSKLPRGLQRVDLVEVESKLPVDLSIEGEEETPDIQESNE